MGHMHPGDHPSLALNPFVTAATAALVAVAVNRFGPGLRHGYRAYPAVPVRA